MSSSIGKRIEQYYAKSGGDYKSPTQRLKVIIDKMAGDLERYRSNPNANTYLLQQKAELIRELFEIHATLESLEPLDVWNEINSRVADSCLTSDQSDIALIYLPLKMDRPPYKSSKLAIIDLAGLNFENPYHYSLHGEVNQL